MNEIFLDTISESSPVQYLELFVNYSSQYLIELARKIDIGVSLSEKEILMIIRQYEIDNENLLYAMENGFHPITGCDWSSYTKEEREQRYQRLRNRNEKAVRYLNAMLVAATNK